MIGCPIAHPKFVPKLAVGFRRAGGLLALYKAKAAVREAFGNAKSAVSKPAPKRKSTKTTANVELPNRAAQNLK
jgi:hypothetical protein